MRPLTKELIEQFAREWDERWTPEDADFHALCALAIKGLDTPVTEAREKWILVSERKPEKHGHYLVVNRETVEIMWFQNDEETDNCPRWWADDSLDYSEPTHWMPLPEAPMSPLVTK